jgi:uncharacterized membrane protein YoaT (DUF817 family)
MIYYWKGISFLFILSRIDFPFELDFKIETDEEVTTIKFIHLVGMKLEYFVD